MNVRKNKLVSLAALGLAAGFALTACGGGAEEAGGGAGSDNGATAAGNYAELSGNLAGAGASSMQNAQTAWRTSGR